MTFEDYLIVYSITLVAFALVDAFWLGGIARDLYKDYLKRRLAKPPNWNAAIAFYMIYVAGLVYFAIQPAIEAENPVQAALHAGFYGFFTYATYQLTNLATLIKWPRELVVVDIAWGTVACFSAAVLTYVTYTGLIS